MKLKEGFYTSDQLPIDVYHSDRDTISQSGLKKIDQSPAHLRAYLDEPSDKKQTRGMFMGSAIHAAALEPHVFDDQYIVAPGKFDRLNAAGFKAWKEEQDPRKTIMLVKDYDKVLNMRKALFDHPWVGPRLIGATTEYSCIARDPETGVLCRVRFDIVTEAGMILDLKKTRDARDAALARTIASYGYHVQNAFYLDVPTWLNSAPKGFGFVFIEEEPPHAIAVRFLNPDDIQRGRGEYRRTLTKYAECLATDKWPAYDTEPQFISLPDWERRKIDLNLIGE